MWPPGLDKNQAKITKLFPKMMRCYRTTCAFTALLNALMFVVIISHHYLASRAYIRLAAVLSLDFQFFRFRKLN